MSPLDDQLRSALHGRASSLDPSPDPLAGIETRARGIRRRRVGAAVAGAALAVAAIAVAVPTLTSSSGKKATDFATQAPTTVATAFALDAQHPWAFRGEPVPADVLATFQRDWAALHPGSTLTPLFARVYESSGLWESAFVASGGGAARYGFITGSAASSNLLQDEPLADGTTALTFALPGDEVARLLIVAAPDSQKVSYAKDGVRFVDLVLSSVSTSVSTGGAATSTTADLTGIGLTPLEGDTSHDRVRITGADGSVVYDQPAPELARSDQPANVLEWPARGSDASSLLPAARAGLAPSLQATPEQVLLRVLFAGKTDSGVHYVTGQAWKRGAATAYPFSYAEGGSNGPQPFLGATTGADAQVLAFLIDSLPGSGTDLLVVVPSPRTTQVLYSASGNASYRAPADTPGTDGVVLINRVIDRGTGITDHLQLLTGNGDPATDVIAEGPVMKYLCGIKECA